MKVKIVPITNQAGIEGMWRALSVNNLGARRGWVFSAFPQLPYPWENNLVPILREIGWTSWLL